MASAQLRTETVVKKFVRLDLSEEEAKFLADLLGQVGGNPNGRCAHGEKIAEALKGEGFDFGRWVGHEFHGTSDMTGSVIVS